jgi:Prokaryotic E2 family E
MLAPSDEAYLRGKGLEFEVAADQGLICVVIKNYLLPGGYDRASTDLLLRLPKGFPDAQPDMFWCDPPVRIAGSGAFPQAADLMESYLGRTWQRFSRHLNAGVWSPGTDNLGSYMSLVGAELERSLRGPR